MSDTFSSSNSDGHMLGDLLNGIPKLEFIRLGTPNSTNHTAGHAEIVSRKCMEFNILNEFKANSLWHVNNAHLRRGSSFLWNACINRRQVPFASESGSNFYISTLFADLAAMLTDDLEFVVLDECSITNEKGSGSHRADFWMVQISDRPLFPVVGKAPPADKYDSAVKKNRHEQVMLKKRGQVVQGADYGVAGESSPQDGDEEDSDDETYKASETEETSENSQKEVIPLGAEKLDDARVLGQIRDYMKVLQQYYGVAEVLGLISTMKHFRIVGLPGCEALWQTEDITLDRTPVTSRVLSTRSRDVVVSPIYRHDDPNLVRLLLSLIKKTAHAQRVDSLPLLSSQRLYVVLSEQTWCWTRPKKELVDSWKAGLTLLPREQPHLLPSEASADATGGGGGSFVVIRPLHLKPKSKVWLCLVKKSPKRSASVGTICVVKQVESEDAARCEQQLWQKVNGVSHVSVHTVCRMRAVVMPFVITAKQTPGDNASTAGTISFDFDPVIWLVQSHASVKPNDIPDIFQAFTAQMKYWAGVKGLLHVPAAAAEAVRRMAEQGYCHTDLEWRHVALIPEYNVNNNSSISSSGSGSIEITGVHAGLIDFENTKELAGPDQIALAEEIMNDKLQDPIENCKFSTSEEVEP